MVIITLRTANYPADIYLFKVNNGNTTTMFKANKDTRWGILYNCIRCTVLFISFLFLKWYFSQICNFIYEFKLLKNTCKFSGYLKCQRNPQLKENDLPERVALSGHIKRYFPILLHQESSQTQNTKKVLPCNLFFNSLLRMRMVESGNKPILFTWQLSWKI